MKGNRLYYYDEKNDLLEFQQGNEDTFAKWVNPYLTLIFPHDCKDLIPENIVGFQLNGLKYLISKAKEQAAEPIPKKVEELMDGLLKKQD